MSVASRRHPPPRPDPRRRRCRRLIAGLIAVLACALAATAAAEQASSPGSPAAGRIATGRYHSCFVLTGGALRCWGYGTNGALGYGNADSVGDDETPASVGPVDLGSGRTATAISAGDFHTCAILDDGSVRCWGYGANGRLGYGSTASVGVTQSPGSLPPVDLAGHRAVAIAAGGAHTCAILDDGTVRCWGFAYDGQLGYGSTATVGDGPGNTPGTAGPVDLGGGRTATAITAGEDHTCAILDDGSVRCWGFGGNGALGYGSTNNVGDTPASTPASEGPVDLGVGRTAKAISAGDHHTCAILDDGSVRCWGAGAEGELGYGSTAPVGELAGSTPASAGPVDLGAGRTAVAITAGGAHTCAILDDGSVRCWGSGAFGQLGYGNGNDVGAAPGSTPAAAGPVDLGPGRTAVAISAGQLHTCALLDDGGVRCWGAGANGRLGYCGEGNIGLTPATVPGAVGRINLVPGDGGVACRVVPPPASGPTPAQRESARARALRRCLAALPRRPARARRRARGRCLGRYGRTPGRVGKLGARTVSRTAIVLRFTAPGSDGRRPPAARSYLIVQSTGERSGRRSRSLCHGRCRFAVSAVGTRLALKITHLRPGTTYRYTVTARDNVSGRLGPRSASVSVRTRR